MDKDLSELENAVKDIEELDKKTSDRKEAVFSKEQEIAFHKGSLNTLINERKELIRMVQNVEAIMQAHLKRIKELEENEGKD